MFAKIRQHLKGWKTIILNIIAGLPAAAYVLYTQLSTIDYTPVIPAQYVAYYAVGSAVLNVVMRVITTGPVGSKGDEAPAPDAKAGD